MKLKLSKIVSLSAMAGMFSTLVACGGGGGGSNTTTNTNNPPPPTTIDVATVSGTTMTLKGVFSSACDPILSASGNDGLAYTLSIDGLYITIITNFWQGNNTCSGTPTGSYSTTGKITVGGAFAINGWFTYTRDLKGNLMLAITTAPTAADGSGPLSDTETFSVMNATVISTTDPQLVDGSNIQIGFVVDDTGTSPVLYDMHIDNAGNYLGVINYSKK